MFVCVYVDVYDHYCMCVCAYSVCAFYVHECVFMCHLLSSCSLKLYTNTFAGSDGDCVRVSPPSGTHHCGDGEATLLHTQQVKVQHTGGTFQVVFKGKSTYHLQMMLMRYIFCLKL